MGVRECFRKDCENIMCDHHSSEHGYICNHCLTELREDCMKYSSITEFMSTPKQKPDSFSNVMEEEDRVRIIERAFS